MGSEDIDAGQGILHHEEGVDLLPGNIDLSVTEANLISVMCRESILRSYVSMVRDRYDYIIIDCTPSFGKLTINALTSADSVIVPITAAYLPTRGLQQLLHTISMVKKRTNKDLYIEGILIAMASNGTAAIVCFPGIIYRGGAEMKIRKYLIDNNYVDCVIQLPSNLFFGTSIATCIMVLKKGKPDSRVLFIDATNECIKVTNNNKLTQSNMDKMTRSWIPLPAVRRSGISLILPVRNDYNLLVSTYVEAEDTREKIDIVKLNAEIREIVAREQVLRDEIDKIIAEIEGRKNG